MRVRSSKHGMEHRNALIIVCWLLVTGCHYPSKGNNKMITEAQAIEIAKKEFEKHDLRAAEHTITIETYHADDKQWIVWFDESEPFPTPGGNHAVLVNKTTGEAEFLPGE